MARRFDAFSKAQWFLVYAIATVLVTRAFLAALGYPSIGGEEGLHIAHMLPGGLLMLAAIVLLLLVVGSAASREIAVLLGGVGFGLFIDELGKFVTADNNYFFQPAFAAMYLLFVAAFLVVRAVQRRHGGWTQREYLANALDLATTGAASGLDQARRARALRYLAAADPDHPLVETLRRYFVELPATEQAPLLERGRQRAASLYRLFLERRRVRLAVIGFFVLHGVVALVLVSSSFLEGTDGLPFVAWARGVSAAVSAVLALAGAEYVVRGRRVEGLRLFERAALVSLLVTSVFLFASSIWAAFGLTVWTLVVLAAVRGMLEEERELADRREGWRGRVADATSGA